MRETCVPIVQELFHPICNDRRDHLADMLLTMSTEAPMFSIIYAGARPEIGYIGRRDKHQWRLPGVGKDQLVG